MAADLIQILRNRPKQDFQGGSARVKTALTGFSWSGIGQLFF
jgi:hypothetical protein